MDGSPAGAGISHPKRQLFVDSYPIPVPARKRKSNSNRIQPNDGAQQKSRKVTAPKEPREKRIPLTPEARRERHRADAEKKRETAKARGLCRHCSKPAIPGQTRCEKCAENHRVSRRKRNAEIRAKNKEAKDLAQAIILAERIAAGTLPKKCQGCKNPPRLGQTRCDTCAARHNRYRAKSEAKKKAEARQISEVELGPGTPSL